MQTSMKASAIMVKTPVKDVAKKTKKRRAQTKKSTNVRKKPSPEVVPVATYVEVVPPPRFATATPVNPPPCGNNLHRPL